MLYSIFTLYKNKICFLFVMSVFCCFEIISLFEIFSNNVTKLFSELMCYY